MFCFLILDHFSCNEINLSFTTIHKECIADWKSKCNVKMALSQMRNEEECSVIRPDLLKLCKKPSIDSMAQPSIHSRTKNQPLFSIKIYCVFLHNENFLVTEIDKTWNFVVDFWRT